MTDAARSDRLTMKEAGDLGCIACLPALFLNMCFSLSHRIGDTAGWQLITLYTLNVAIAVFAALPWGIRCALRGDFNRFHFVVLRPGSRQESHDLTYGERLKLSMLAAFGTAGMTVLPIQWAHLAYPHSHWSVEMSVWLAITLGGWTFSGVLLLRNLCGAFSLSIRRPVNP